MNASMGRIGVRYPLARPIGPQFPGQPIRSTPVAKVADAPYTARSPIISGAYMSPDVVAASLRQCELGYMSRYTDLLSECREKVPHLQAVLANRELSVAGCPWRIEPKEHGDKKRKNVKATKVADYAREVFEEIPHFGEAIQHLMMAVYTGRSALEIVWQRTADGLGIRELCPIHPKRLSYAVNWRMHLWDEYGNEYDRRLGNFPGIDLETEYPDKFVLHAPLTMGGEIPTRQGLGRVLVWYALFSVWTQRDWMRFAEIYAQPWRVAFYDKMTADQDDIQAIKNALQEMSNATTAVLPDTTKFELKMPTGRMQVHEALRNAMNAEISKVVLGQTLTTESPGHGTQALGKVQENVKLDIKQNDGRSISESIQHYVLRPLIVKQFGDAVAREFMPDFSIVTESETDLNAEFTRAIGLADRGCPIDVDDARTLYTSLPKPENPDPGTLLIPIGHRNIQQQDPAAPPVDPEGGAPAPPTGPAGGPPGAPPPKGGKPPAPDAKKAPEPSVPAKKGKSDPGTVEPTDKPAEPKTKAA